MSKSTVRRSTGFGGLPLGLTISGLGNVFTVYSHRFVRRPLLWVASQPLMHIPPLLQVAVLAGSIEAAAGEETSARALFMRAYQLSKADKQLYMAWPRMEGATGNIERARALFQSGLSLYPNNTKILNLYACFEEDQGNVELARQLHRNALDVDGSSLTAMHNR